MPAPSLKGSALAVSLVALLLVCGARGTTYNLTPSTSGWQSTITNLQPGDTAILSAGTYTVSGYFAPNLAGTAAQPITIIYQPTDQQNIIDFGGTYFSVYNITFTGGSRGIRLRSGVSNALFEDLKIHDTPETAFTANDVGSTYTDLTIRHVEVYNTGTATSECFYLGCNNDGCRVVNSLVERNYCHDTMGALDGYGSGIQLKTGSSGNIIRDNVLYNTKGPGILIYDDYQRGVNLVEGNVIMTTGDVGLQLTAGAIIRNNIVVGAGSYGIYVSNNQIQTSGVWHDIQIVHNTVYSSGSPDLYLPALSGSQFVIANNAFLSSVGAFSVNTQTNTVWIKNAYVLGDVPTGVTAGSGVFQVNINAVGNAAANNFYPPSGSALINAGGTGYASPATEDFNDTPRSGSTPTVGAYEYTTPSNPGWAITTGFKSFPSTGGGSTATPSPSVTPSRSPSNSPSRSPTTSSSPSRSVIPTNSPTRSPGASNSQSPSTSPSISVTPSVTRSPSSSATTAASQNPSSTKSATPTQSPSRSPTPSVTPSRSPSSSPTRLPSLSPSFIPSRSSTPSPSASPTASPTSSISPSTSASPSPSSFPQFSAVPAANVTFDNKNPAVNVSTSTDGSGSDSDSGVIAQVSLQFGGVTSNTGSSVTTDFSQTEVSDDGKKVTYTTSINGGAAQMNVTFEDNNNRNATESVRSFAGVNFTLPEGALKWTVDIQGGWPFDGFATNFTVSQNFDCTATITSIIKRAGFPRQGMTTYYLFASSLGTLPALQIVLFDLADVDGSVSSSVSHSVTVDGDKGQIDVVLPRFANKLLYDPVVSVGSAVATYSAAARPGSFITSWLSDLLSL